MVAGQTLMRLRLESRNVAIETVPHGDTVPIPIRQTTVERGEIFWSPSSGLVRRTRDITVDATIPAGGRVRQPARSRVVQRIQLTRLLSPTRLPRSSSLHRAAPRVRPPGFDAHPSTRVPFGVNHFREGVCGWAGRTWRS